MLIQQVHYTGSRRGLVSSAAAVFHDQDVRVRVPVRTRSYLLKMNVTFPPKKHAI